VFWGDFSRYILELEKTLVKGKVELRFGIDLFTRGVNVTVRETARTGFMFISEMLGDGPSLTAICTGFFGLGLAGLFLSVLRWWASLPIVFVLCLLGIVLLTDLYAEDLYPIYSTDPEFLKTATAAIIFGTLLPLIGIVIHISRRFNTIK
jgi:hypothetical protein